MSLRLEYEVHSPPPGARGGTRALAAGDLDAALAAAREQAAGGRRILKAASGRHAPATRPGALRDLVEEHLRKFPEAAFTPHQVGKVLTRSAGAVANALDKLTALGTARYAEWIANQRELRCLIAEMEQISRQEAFRMIHTAHRPRRSPAWLGGSGRPVSWPSPSQFTGLSVIAR